MPKSTELRLPLNPKSLNAQPATPALFYAGSSPNPKGNAADRYQNTESLDPEGFIDDDPVFNTMSNITSAIANLQANWNRLPDYERAQAVQPIIRSGMSRRQLAKELNTSEGTIRNLLLILKAPYRDLAPFRGGQLSLNELLRRVRGSRPGSEAPRQQFKNSNLAPAPAGKPGLRFAPLLPLK